MSKKRRQNLDAVTELSGADIKQMLSDTSEVSLAFPHIRFTCCFCFVVFVFFVSDSCVYVYFRTVQIVKTKFSRPARQTRTEALYKRRASLPIDVLFTMPATFTLDKALWKMFQRNMHTDGVKRRRLMGDEPDVADDDVELARQQNLDQSLVLGKCGE